MPPEIINFFNTVFHLIAETGGNIALLEEGIGADRISDTTAGILRHRLAAYTEQICTQHSVPMTARHYLRGKFDVDDERWNPLDVSLPTNPHNGKGILLVPRRYLRDLPTANADDFWEYCYDNHNETLRREFGDDIKRKVKKRSIVALARDNEQFRKEFLEKLEKGSARPYDFAADEKGIHKWYDDSKRHVAEHPLQFEVNSNDDFCAVVDQMVHAFKHHVEEHGGWRLLWNEDGTRRNEMTSQNLFLGTVIHYCKANNIDVSPEANIGRGPVDFKVSRGFELRALVEVKLARNTRFWNGLEKQLPTYMHAEGIRRGYLVVIVYDENDDERVRDIRRVVEAVNDEMGYEITGIVVDATKDKPSASKL